MIRNWLNRSKDAAGTTRPPALDAAHGRAVVPTGTEDQSQSAFGRARSAIDWIYWIALWRAPRGHDVDDAQRSLDLGQPLDGLATRLITSQEFRFVYEAVRGELMYVTIKGVEPALDALGSDDEFVGHAYQTILGRPADDVGRGFYAAELGRGVLRILVIKSLLLSDEFGSRYASICPQSGHIPRDQQLCELANPAKWDNPEWVSLLGALKEPLDKLSMHRKSYEMTQLIYGLSRLDKLQPSTRVLSVGAGHEPVLYWLANRVAEVIGTDMYSDRWEDEGAREGDVGVLVDPARFAPFPYERDRLRFMRMDGRALAFAAATFDVVYSLSSIEHFGGLAGARESMVDMARVLKPGGILAVATEYCVGGPPAEEAFQPAEIRDLFSVPGLRLVEPIDERVWQRYGGTPVDVRVNPTQTPHMLVINEGSIYTSVMAFFERTSIPTAGI